MKRFARLFGRLDRTRRILPKVEALAAYFREAPPRDAAWAVQLLRGQRPRRVLGPRELAVRASEEIGIREWLFEECYEAVGDLAETIALLLPPPTRPRQRSLAEAVAEILALRELDSDERAAGLKRIWEELPADQRLVWTKLVTGGFRVGVSQRLVVRGLAAASGVDEAALEHRLAGRWTPSAESYRALLSDETADADRARPYPFFLARPVEGDPADLGPVDEWVAEWKWDGIRAQLVRREGETWIWSRGGELVTEAFPDVAEAGETLPDGTVLDGELLAWRDGAPLGFASLQRRLGRKKAGRKLRSEVPVALVAWDLLEERGRDLRSAMLEDRRARLESTLRQAAAPCLMLSPRVDAGSWPEREALRVDARSRGAEGLMLKRVGSVYGSGRRGGDWKKWKLDPWTVDAVLIYAQRGHGRRASLYTDYTFGVWTAERELVPFAKAYSGLTDAEIRRVDRFVRRHTRERFGPVRSVEPRLVFEIAFEGIRRSTRHKSGVAVRFPRIARWREDKRPEDADDLETVKALL